MHSSSTAKAIRSTAPESTLSARPVFSEAEMSQAAERLRARLCSMPFYAERAAKHKAEVGSEMVYWRALPGVFSEAAKVRAASSTAGPTTLAA